LIFINKLNNLIIKKTISLLYCIINMGYKSLKECIIDLEKNGHLIRIKEEVDPNLEMATIH